MIDAMSLYKMIKMQRPSMIQSAYRVYFSNMINGKMISGGITGMSSLVYNVGGIPRWIINLNSTLKIQDTPNVMPNRISMSSTELQERVILAQNSTPLNKAPNVITVRPSPFVQVNPFGTPRPFGGR